MLKHVRACFAELGAEHGMVFAGVAGCRGDGAGCHNWDCTRPGRVKKVAGWQSFRAAGGGTAVSSEL
jgi:hypothetical protein